MKWKKCRKNDHLLSVANTFSGGVFLAIAFVHIIPETASLYYEYKFSQPVLDTNTNSTVITAANALMSSTTPYESFLLKLK